MTVVPIIFGAVSIILNIVEARLGRGKRSEETKTIDCFRICLSAETRIEYREVMLSVDNQWQPTVDFDLNNKFIIIIIIKLGMYKEKVLTVLNNIKIYYET